MIKVKCRKDGTFVVDVRGNPCHVTKEYYKELYEDIVNNREDSNKYCFEEDDTKPIKLFRDLTESEKLEADIIMLKKELFEEDYKVIKCYESFLTNQEYPYDINDLCEKRNIIRNKINELERLKK